MQELKLIRWCDPCRDEDQRVPSIKRFLVSIDEEGAPNRRAAPRFLDCCEVHLKLVTELRDLTLKLGSVVRTEEAAVADEDDVRTGRCPISTCGKLMHHASVVPHLLAIHGARRPKPLKKCPDCGKPIAAFHILVKHRKDEHGYDYQADVASTAKKGRR